MLYLVQYSQNTIIPIYNQHDNVNEICYILFITLSLSNLVCTLTLTAHLNPVILSAQMPLLASGYHLGEGRVRNNFQK